MPSRLPSPSSQELATAITSRSRCERESQRAREPEVAGHEQHDDEVRGVVAHAGGVHAPALLAHDVTLVVEDDVGVRGDDESAVGRRVARGRGVVRGREAMRGCGDAPDDVGRVVDRVGLARGLCEHPVAHPGGTRLLVAGRGPDGRELAEHEGCLRVALAREGAGATEGVALLGRFHG